MVRLILLFLLLCTPAYAQYGNQPYPTGVVIKNNGADLDGAGRILDLRDNISATYDSLGSSYHFNVATAGSTSVRLNEILDPDGNGSIDMDGYSQEFTNVNIITFEGYNVTTYTDSNVHYNSSTLFGINASIDFTNFDVTSGGNVKATKVSIEDGADSSKYTTFTATGQTADIDYTLPSTAPTDDYVLSSDSNGALSWANRVPFCSDPITEALCFKQVSDYNVIIYIQGLYATEWDLTGVTFLTNSNGEYLTNSSGQRLVVFED